MIDRKNSFTFKKGKEKKLTDTDVEKILTSAKNDTETALDFGVSQVYVSKIRRGEARRYVYEKVILGKDVEIKTNLSRDFDECYSKDSKSGCWIWLGATDKDGYGTSFPNVKAHRESFSRAFGNIPKGMLVCHKCNVKKCVNPAHLYLGTIQQNTADAVRDGLIPKGENSPHAKLKESEVVEILKSDKSYLTLARKYNVTKGLIGHIKKGLAWKHVHKKLAAESAK